MDMTPTYPKKNKIGWYGGLKSSQEGCRRGRYHIEVLGGF